MKRNYHILSYFFQNTWSRKLQCFEISLARILKNNSKYSYVTSIHRKLVPYSRLLCWCKSYFIKAHYVTLHLSSNIGLQPTKPAALPPIALFSTFLNISLLSTNQLNTSVLVLALMLLRFGMTCLLIYTLLHHWCFSGAGSRHIFLERPILVSNLHIPVVLLGADPAISLILGFG